MAWSFGAYDDERLPKMLFGELKKKAALSWIELIAFEMILILLLYYPLVYVCMYVFG